MRPTGASRCAEVSGSLRDRPRSSSSSWGVSPRRDRSARGSAARRLDCRLLGGGSRRGDRWPAAGFEHPDDRSATGRGAVAGAIYGVALLIAHAIAGTHAKVSLGSFPPLLALITAIIGAVLAVIGERITRRRG